MPARQDAQVIVAGAGPAGAVTALRLAEAGHRVILCDRHAFPRDKACGDGLIADSLAALRLIGLENQVAESAYRAGRLLVVSPSGIEVNFEETFWVIPRLAFDQILFDRAIVAGAEFRQMVVEAPIVEGGRVVGVTGHSPDSKTSITLRAPLTVLATGGDGGVLKKFDASARAAPSGFAIRTYARPIGGDARSVSHLIISLERELLPGYGWAFPAPGGVLNVGVGTIVGRQQDQPKVNLRTELDKLLAGGGRLGALLGPMESVDRYRGAPLRTGLTGSRLGAMGLAIVGEAGGTTFDVTGEGIGKALESGILAAELAGAAGDDLAAVGPLYATAMRDRYAARFKTYATAHRWMAYPRITDYIAKRANQNRWVHDRLSRVITERDFPTSVFSARTIWRLLLSQK